MEGVKIKADVRFDPGTLARSEFWAMSDAAQATSPNNYFITITSGCDGKHDNDSKHYTGWGKDIRVRDFPGVAFKKEKGKWKCSTGKTILLAWVKRIQRRLGNRYFVQLEEKKVHIHMQFNG